MELVHDSLIGTREVVTWYEGKFNPNLGKNGRMNLWLLPARFFSKKSSSQVTHFFSVCQGRSASKRAEMPEDRVPEERFEFNEDVHHDCKEMESVSLHRPHPRLDEQLGKHIVDWDTPLRAIFLKKLRLGAATTAAV